MWCCAGGTDLTQGDRDDLQQLERAVRGRLLELQLLKLAVQSQNGQEQHTALLDVASSTTQPKVSIISRAHGLHMLIMHARQTASRISTCTGVIYHYGKDW